MTKFLVVDAITNDKVWVEAASAREACIKRENELRAAADAHWTRAGKPALPVGAKASQYSDGRSIDVTVADSYVRGLPENVVRQSAS